MKRAIARFAGIFIVASSAFAQTPDFGLPSFHTPLDSSAMNPWDAGFIASRNVATADLSCTVLSTQSRALGQVVLPHGADIEEIRVWGTDSSAMSNMQVQLIASCLPDTAPGAPMLTALATVLSAGSGGDFSLFAGLPGTNVADNQSCTYRVEVRLGPNNTSCDPQLSIWKVCIQWKRITPLAPTVATFTDVPTNAQFFREIQALAASGITAGCTATQFCPENPLTRRQMAAFLARALGLASQTIPDPANP